MKHILSRNVFFAIFGLAIAAPVSLYAQVMPGDKPSTRPAADAPVEVKKLSLDQFDTMRANKGNVVLDVRTPKEFAAGHVPGAVNIDWHARDFKEQVAKLDKSKTYLVHCQSGVRSAAATKQMTIMDFTHLYDFSGGYSAYEKAGKPAEK